jgi:hypothetical protein
MESLIALAEARLAGFEAEQASPEVASNAHRLVELASLIESARSEVDALYQRWSELEAMVQGP